MLNGPRKLVRPLVPFLLVTVISGSRLVAQERSPSASAPVRLQIAVAAGIALPAEAPTYSLEVALHSAWRISPVARVSRWSIASSCISLGACFTRGWSWEGGLAYRLLGEDARIQPYLGATVGQMSMTDEFEDERYRFWMWGAQAGADVALSRALALRLGGRYAALPSASENSPLLAGVVGLQLNTPPLR